MAATDLVLALTGASGAPYGVRLLEVLLRAGRTVHLSLSPAAVEVIEQELDRRVALERFALEDLLGEAARADLPGRVCYHHFRDFRAGIASGSFLTGGMVVCPCRMGTVAAIAHGLSQNLIHRAADVHLKERRRLVLVPRETPLHLVQLRNLAGILQRLEQAGVCRCKLRRPLGKRRQLVAVRGMIVAALGHPGVVPACPHGTGTDGLQDHGPVLTALEVVQCLAGQNQLVDRARTGLVELNGGLRQAGARAVHPCRCAASRGRGRPGQHRAA
jgi:flavin prenyltransferase